MKRCPTCQKTFDDSTQFCYTDGTPLVEDTAANTAGAKINDDDDADLLQLHDAPVTTAASGSRGGFDGEINLDDLDDEFDKKEPSASSPSSNFGSQPSSSYENSLPSADVAATTPLASNLDSFSNEPSNQTPFETASASPSSPFDAPSPSSYQPPPFQEPEQRNELSFSTPQQEQTPFNQPSVAQPLERQSQWTPPPAPEANWQSQNIGANTPFQPPLSGQAQNQTLPIISLVCGILGLVGICCYGGIPLGIVALVTGFLGLQNVNKDSMNFGGKSMAIAGMALGAAALVLNIIFIVLGIAIGTLSNLSR